MTTIDDLADVVRSKNAGPYYTTIDLFFSDPVAYRRVVSSGVLTEERIAGLYGLEPRQVYGIFALDAAQGIKITIEKLEPTDAPGNLDVMGAHQHLPVAGLEVPDVEGTGETETGGARPVESD